MTRVQNPTPRWPALDWMRGLVMMLMAVDHADGLVSAQRHLGGDGLLLRGQGSAALEAGPLLTRVSTHLCAATFLFLAGTSIALSAARMRARGLGEARITGHFALRGAVLIVLELTVMGMIWARANGAPMTLLLVLYAIGGAMIAMSLLRLLPTAAVVALGLGLILGVEPAIEALGGFRVSPPAWQAALLAGGAYGAGPGIPPSILIAYPIAGWLGVMCLGFGLGKRILSGRAIAPWLILWGLLAVGLAVGLRYLGTIGEMGLPRDPDGNWMHWLRMSKYPPSVTFISGFLGTSAVLLGALWLVQPKRGGRLDPFLVLGQVPLFFYLAHIPAIWLIVEHAPGEWFPRNTVQGTWLAALACIVAMYPACWLYRAYKQKYRHAWTRYL